MSPADPKEVVRRGYDAVSYAYRSDDAADGNYGRWVSRFQGYLPGAGSVLDLGCGAGIPVCRILAGAGFSVTGVDISDVQIRRARRLVPRATFISADATRVDFPAASFDGVICLFALIHIPLDEQLPLLQRIARWLRPGGALLVTTGHTAWTGMEANWHGAPMWWSHADAATYRAWLAEAGFRVREEDFFPEGEAGHALFYATRIPASG
jgi:SAM-dependent methyltransferase